MIDRRVWLVARWEFLRFAKTKDLIIGTLVLAAIYGGSQLLADFARGRSTQERTVAVAEADGLLADAPLQLDTVSLVPDRRGLAVLDSLVLAGDLDGVLAPADGGQWHLRVRDDRAWQDALRTRFAALVWQHDLRALDLEPRVLEALNRAPDIATVALEPAGDGARPSILVVVMVVGAMLLGLFTGFSYVFVAITAEKTQRTTESLLSVLTPQQWIDGKILGLIGVVLVNLLSFLVAWYLWQGASWLLLDRTLALPGGLGGSALVLSLLFAAAGFAFWFTLFALVAATIDDPNSSSRSGLMFLPFLPLSLVFVGLDAPDAGWMRALALIPGVSPSAMPVRILLGEPAAWEIAVSLLLLAAGAMALRWAAGRVFGISMMMTGKEPGVREVWRWLREPR